MDSEVNSTSGIVVKVFFLIYLSKGFGAIKKLKEQDGTVNPELMKVMWVDIVGIIILLIGFLLYKSS